MTENNIIPFPGSHNSTANGTVVTQPLNVEQALHAGVATVCAYETYAIVTGKVPTVSTLCGRYPALVPVILIGLGVHLVWSKIQKWWSA